MNGCDKSEAAIVNNQMWRRSTRWYMPIVWYVCVAAQRGEPWHCDRGGAREDSM